jgi:hypothetical protein
MIEIVVTNEQGRESEPDSVTITVNPANTPSNPLPLLFERILGFGGNTNIQAQENRENNLDGHLEMIKCIQTPTLQHQSTEQDNSVEF